MNIQTISDLSEILGDIGGGRVLDIATGRGGFVNLLCERLTAFDAIVGVDTHRHVLLEAYAQCLGPKVHFIQMEVSCLGFRSACFDLSCASACLHHLEDAHATLQEAWRILKPGGRFLLVEMHRDAVDEPQRSAVLLHHWAADVDAARGISHRYTFSRKELLEHVSNLKLHDLEIYDWVQEPEDPRDPATIERLSAFIDEHLERAHETTEYPALLHRAVDIRQRLAGVGVRREPVLAICGIKP